MLNYDVKSSWVVETDVTLTMKRVLSRNNHVW